MAILFRTESDEHAIEIANDSPFGLGASVLGADLVRLRRAADRLVAGMVYFSKSGGSQADLPFEGSKRSGMGRGLGPSVIEELMNQKSIRF